MDHLITKSDLSSAMQGVELRLGTLERAQLEDRKRLLEHDERWQALARSTVRRGVWVSAAITAIGVVMVAVINAVSNHSFAVAREKVREMNRQDRADELQQLSVHDELLIRKAIQEHERQQLGLIVKGAP